MKENLKRVLKSWKKSILNTGKVDNWNISSDLCVLGNYLRYEKDDNVEVLSLVRNLRDRIIYSTNDTDSKSAKIITRLLNLLEPKDFTLEKAIKRVAKNKKDCGSQRRRFKGVTQRIFNERLKFKGGMLLRNFDIETEAASDSRIVRKIIEKRMCQAYYKMMRSYTKFETPTNIDRYSSRRATRFQLFNIGQVDDIHSQTRGDSTHWKHLYDEQTGKMVLKKKVAFQTWEEAQEGLKSWRKKHPWEYFTVNAYKCASCGKWHIGHNYPGVVHKSLDPKYDLSSSSCTAYIPANAS
jgi:hypothetical protein